MEKKDIITLIALIILVALTSIISVYTTQFQILSFAILIISAFKFIAVAFQFMELKKAHAFWKILISGFLVLFSVIIYLIL